MSILRSGETNPTTAPYCHPQRNPQRSAGMCMGQSIEPICGICPVRNGSTIARARHSAEYVSFLINKLDLVFAAFIFTPQLKEKRYRFPPRKNRHLHDIISRKYCK